MVPQSSFISFDLHEILAERTELSLEWCLPSLEKIGPDLDIAPFYYRLILSNWRDKEPIGW